MADSLEVVAQRIARIAMKAHPKLGTLGAGPVLTVARDDLDGTISVGLNTGTPAKVADVIRDAIKAQGGRITNGEVVVVRSDSMAREGGHAEVNALNPLILRREKKLGRKLTETDLRTFEIHNIWLKGFLKGTTAARCEHCARITRGVSVTQSLFIAEGGVIGEITVPQRGAVKRAGNPQAEHVTTVSGTISPTTKGEIKVPQRGSVTRSGNTQAEEVTSASGTISPTAVSPHEEAVGAVASGMLDAAFSLVEAVFKQWYYDKYLKDRWDKAAREMVQGVITANKWRFDLLIALNMANVLKAREAHRRIMLHICLDTYWVATEIAPVQTAAEIKYYSLLFGDDKPVDPPTSFWSELWQNTVSSGRITTNRMVVDIPL